MILRTWCLRLRQNHTSKHSFYSQNLDSYGSQNGTQQQGYTAGDKSNFLTLTVLTRLYR